MSSSSDEGERAVRGRGRGRGRARQVVGARTRGARGGVRTRGARGRGVRRQANLTTATDRVIAAREERDNQLRVIII